MKKFKDGLCPVCQSALKINRLMCTECGAEYPVSEELSKFQLLTEEQLHFFETFLRCKGSLKAVGEAYSISYPTVKKRFDEILKKLGYLEESEEPVMLNPTFESNLNYQSLLPSEIIQRKLFENGGQATIPQLQGGECTIRFTNGGAEFVTDKIRSGSYQLSFPFTVFDRIVDFLKKCPNGRAPKGNGRNKECKVGYGDCCEGTVIYVIATECFGKTIGESTLDPVFVFAAILDWAGIANNERSTISLTAEYRMLTK